MKTTGLFILLMGLQFSYAQQQISSDTIGTFIKTHRYQLALNRLERDLLDSSSVDYLNLSAFCYAKLGRYEKAIALYKQSLVKDSTNLTTLIQLADLYKKRDNYMEASELYGILNGLDSANSYFYKHNAYCMYKLGHIPLATILYEQAASLNPLDEDIVLKLSGLYMKQDRFADCDSLLNPALHNNPDNSRLLSKKARNKYYQQQFDSVKAVLQTLFSQGDTSFSNMQLMGNALYALNDYSGSIYWFEQLPEAILKESESAQYIMGVCYRYLKNLDKSIFHLQKAIALGISDNTALYYHQLGLGFESKKRMDKAMEAFKTSYRYKKQGILLYQMARLLDYRTKQPKAALKYYKRYLASGDSSVKKAWKYSQSRVKQLE